MAIAKKITETRMEHGIMAIYELDQPVRDAEGDETKFVAVSALLKNPDTGKPETIIACLYPCEAHGSHMGRFAPELEKDLTCDEFSHTAILAKLGCTITDGLATFQ